MKESDDKELQKLLRTVFHPMDPELRSDLWPAMLRRIDPTGSPLPWYDWALLAGSAGFLALFPRFILLFAYHF